MIIWTHMILQIWKTYAVSKEKLKTIKKNIEKWLIKDIHNPSTFLSTVSSNYIELKYIIYNNNAKMQIQNYQKFGEFQKEFKIHSETKKNNNTMP